MEWQSFIVPALSMVGGFAGAWGAVKADIAHLKQRMHRVERQVDSWIASHVTETKG